MFPKLPQRSDLIRHAFTNFTFAAATFGVSPAHAQGQQEPPAATAPAKAEPVLRVESFSNKYRDEIRHAIATELDKTIVVVFSIPKQCPACDLYKPEIEKFAKMLETEGSPTKIFVVNFSSFDQAKDFTTIMQGNTRIGLAPRVPTTLVIPKLPDDTIAAIGEPKDHNENQFIPKQPTRLTVRFYGSASARELPEALDKIAEFATERMNAMAKAPQTALGLFDANRGWLGLQK